MGKKQYDLTDMLFDFPPSYCAKPYEQIHLLYFQFKFLG